MPLWVLLCGLLLLLPLPRSANAQDRDDGNQLQTRASQGLEGMAERLKLAWPEVRQFVTGQIGIWYDGPVVCVVARDVTEMRSQLARLGMAAARLNDSIAGLAFPANGVIALNLSAHHNGPMVDDVIRTLRHEYCHLALGRFGRQHGTRLPLWFEEGICQWVQRAGWLPSETSLAVTEGSITMPSLADLDTQIAERDSGTPAAYALAEDAAGFLMSGVPAADRRETMVRFCQQWEQSGDFQATFNEVFGEPLAAFETRWRSHRHKGGLEAWGWFVAHHQVTLMFAACGVLMVLALWMRRRIHRRWLADDAAASARGERDPDDLLLDGSDDDVSDDEWRPSMADPEAAKRAMRGRRW